MDNKLNMFIDKIKYLKIKYLIQKGCLTKNKMNLNKQNIKKFFKYVKKDYNITLLKQRDCYIKREIECIDSYFIYICYHITKYIN